MIVQTKPVTTEAPLPEPNDYVIRAIADWLHGREQSQRVPVKTATVLALICQLYLKQRPFPTRLAIMKHLDLTESLIDMAISQRAAEGLIFVNVKTEQGRVRKRLSSVQRRYIEPSPELLRVFEAAAKRDRTVRS